MQLGLNGSDEWWTTALWKARYYKAKTRSQKSIFCTQTDGLGVGSPTNNTNTTLLHKSTHKKSIFCTQTEQTTSTLIPRPLIKNTKQHYLRSHGLPLSTVISFYSFLHSSSSSVILGIKTKRQVKHKTHRVSRIHSSAKSGVGRKF